MGNQEDISSIRSKKASSMARNNRVEQLPSMLLKKLADEPCNDDRRQGLAETMLLLCVYSLTIFLCMALHRFIFKPMSCHRIIPEFIVGVIIGNLRPRASDNSAQFLQNLPEILGFLVRVTMILYMFVLGQEMEPSKYISFPTPEHMISYITLICSLLLNFLMFYFSSFFKSDTHKFHMIFSLMAAQTMSATSSTILTRQITTLKLGKSDIGKLVKGAARHKDFIVIGIACIEYMFHPEAWVLMSNKFLNVGDSMGLKYLGILSLLVIQVVVVAKAGPVLMNWVDTANPEGKDMKGPHLVISLAFVSLSIYSMTYVGYNPVLSAFVAGVFLPREGRISRLIIGKANHVMTYLLFPALFISTGMVASFRDFERQYIFRSIAQFFLALLVDISGNVIGAALYGKVLGIEWQESVAIGLLLCAKGYFHVFSVLFALSRGELHVATSFMLSLAAIVTVIYIPIIGSHIIARGKKRPDNQKNMALQRLDPISPFRVLVCIYRREDAPAAINFLEIMRGHTDPGVLAFVADSIKLAEDGEVEEGVRDKIVNEIEAAYVGGETKGITVKGISPLKSLDNMHYKLNALADSMMVSLIILPFHKIQGPNGKLDEGNPMFQFINRKVLQNAPCSVGILIDQGIGRISRLSLASSALKAAVIFIGGKDDREVLAYASRISGHPAINLSVVRFLLDKTTDPLATVRVRRVYAQTRAALREEEMIVDDDCFTKFYGSQVATGHVNYVEKHMVNASETFSTLESLIDQYDLIIVGRGNDRANSILTIGLCDWEQCPELGPIGYILSYSSTTSVLVIQQHDMDGQIPGLIDEFCVL